MANLEEIDILKNEIKKLTTINKELLEENTKLKDKIKKLNKTISNKRQETGFISQIDEHDKYILNNMKIRTKYKRLSINMGGCPKPHLFDLNSEKPEIELCEINAFLQRLNLTREKMNSCVYINSCEDGKFYVGYCSGISDNIDNLAEYRLVQHRDNGGNTNFTFLHRVISCNVAFYGDHEDEDLVTMLMTKCVGNNVRGGKWASPFIELPDFSDTSVNDIKNKLLKRHQMK